MILVLSSLTETRKVEMYHRIPEPLLRERKNPGDTQWVQTLNYDTAVVLANTQFDRYNFADPKSFPEEQRGTYVQGYVDNAVGADLAREMMQDIIEFTFRAESMQRNMDEAEIEDYIDFALNGHHS